MDFTIFSGTDFYERIQDEACAHTQGNAIGQWHEKNREEGRESFGDVPPMDIQQAFAHQGTDQDQCGSCDCRHGGNCGGNWQTEKQQDKKEHGEYIGQPGAASYGYTGAGFGIAGCRTG